jgi:hypothetical protein
VDGKEVPSASMEWMRGVMKLDTLKDSKGPQAGATNRERRPGTLKNYRVIAKMPKFD